MFIPPLARLFVDVDGTLLFWPGDELGDVPRPGQRGHGQAPAVNIELVDALVAWRGETPLSKLFVWSANGAEHARWAARVCGLQDLADGYLDKPQKGDGVIDDKPEWHRRFARLTPGGEFPR